MNKKEVKKLLIAEQKEVIENLKQEINDLHQGSDLDEDDTIDPEDFSHQAEISNIEMNLSQRLNSAKEQLSSIENLSDEPMNSIGPGALVESEHDLIYVSIAARSFKYTDKPLFPISRDSPIYKKLLKLNVGDALVIGEEESVIQAIY
ncbi:MAG: hypothetical protein ACI9J3_000201 [Parvicellaceae bacterium]|jgi:hypothetical protein